MNKKAEQFQKYLQEKKIAAFAVEEVQDKEMETTVFRSSIELNGNKLPTIVILDKSVFGMVRVLVVPKALHDENEKPLMQLLNKYNKTYKPLKHYIDDDGNVIIDVCVMSKDDAFDGDVLYGMVELLVKHLTESYKDIMQVVWAK